MLHSLLPKEGAQAKPVTNSGKEILRILIVFFPVKAFSTPRWPFFPDRSLYLQRVIYDNERRKHPVLWET